MSKRFLIKSPCKINLSLTVHKKRDDGYHSLTSIFQLIDLYDEIEVEVLEDSNVINIEGSFNCKQEDNLIYKALDLYMRKANINRGYRISVEKHIPAGGGLGGGSGNAGAILRFLNAIYCAFSHRELNELALEVGSDVPFFLNYPTALVRGRGEVIDKVETLDSYYILLVNPGIHISTGKAFKAVSDMGLNEEENEELAYKLIENYGKGVNYFHNFKNSFENALLKDYNFIIDIETELNHLGADFVSLSGSGSTMFGIFTNFEAAKKAEEVLSIKNYKINLVKPLSSFYDYIEL